MDVECWILTGWRGAGKTTFCQAAIQVARQEGWDVAGILSLPRFEQGVRTAIDAVNIRNGECRHLAGSRREKDSDLIFSHWFFDPDTLGWGNHVLEASVPSEVLIIDELGPLEFNLSSGWISAFNVLGSKLYRLALVVIRPELVEQASKSFTPTRIIQVNSPGEVQSLVQQVAPDWRSLIRPTGSGG